MATYSFYVDGKIANFDGWKLNQSVPYKHRENVYIGDFKSETAVRKKALSLLKTRLKNDKWSEIRGIIVFKKGNTSRTPDVYIRYDDAYGKFWTGKGPLVNADGTLSKRTIWQVWGIE